MLAANVLAARVFLIDYYGKTQKNSPLKQSGYFGVIKKGERFFYKVQILIGTVLKDSLFIF